MKKLLFALATFTAISCSEAEEYKYAFKDQPLQGKIAGKEWKSKVEGVSISRSEGQADGWSFTFTDKGRGKDACGYQKYDVGKILFSTSDVHKTGTVGQLKAGIDWMQGLKQGKVGLNMLDLQTLTMVYTSDSTNSPVNQLALTGAFVFDKVDTTDQNVISGLMDIYVDENNYINGRFEAKYCKN